MEVRKPRLTKWIGGGDLSFSPLALYNHVHETEGADTFMVDEAHTRQPNRPVLCNRAVELNSLSQSINLGVLSDVLEIHSEATMGVLVKWPEGFTNTTAKFRVINDPLFSNRLDFGSHQGIFEAIWQSPDRNELGQDLTRNIRIKNDQYRDDMDEFQWSIVTGKVAWEGDHRTIEKKVYAVVDGVARLLGSETQPYYIDPGKVRTQPTKLVLVDALQRAHFGGYFEVAKALDTTEIEAFLQGQQHPELQHLFLFEEGTGSQVYNHAQSGSVGSHDGVRVLDDLKPISPYSGDFIGLCLADGSQYHDDGVTQVSAGAAVPICLDNGKANCWNAGGTEQLPLNMTKGRDLPALFTGSGYDLAYEYPQRPPEWDNYSIGTSIDHLYQRSASPQPDRICLFTKALSAETYARVAQYTSS